MSNETPSFSEQFVRHAEQIKNGWQTLLKNELWSDLLYVFSLFFCHDVICSTPAQTEGFKRFGSFFVHPGFYFLPFHWTAKTRFWHSLRLFCFLFIIHFWLYVWHLLSPLSLHFLPPFVLQLCKCFKLSANLAGSQQLQGKSLFAYGV